MTEITVHNSKTRRKEVFVPIDPGNVRMYVCGPTVYDRAHLGNARPAVVFDVLFRLLRHVYGAEHVTYARNITDVEDKINARAAETGRAINDITAETTQWYLDDMEALGTLLPNEIPRATQYIPQMVAMIETLIAGGHAYAAEGHVLFRVRSYQAYGALSGRSVDAKIAGARVEVAPYKEDQMDFVLWKKSTPAIPGWDSPWGRGRPGWHIECSAMALELLGKSFDIHAGGNDLTFPHHENEIAQSCCANPDGDFARYWLHNEMLQVEGKKMSKSLGNFFTVRDLLDQGIPGEVIRFVFLQTHYRKPMDWTAEKAKQAKGHLQAWHRLKRIALSDPHRKFAGHAPDPEVVSALAGDLNTPLAIARLFELAVRVKTSTEKDNPDAILFFETLSFLGFVNLDTESEARKASVRNAIGSVQLKELADRMSALRDEAKQTKDFSQVDALKAELVASGVNVRIDRDGVTLNPDDDYDPQEIDVLHVRHVMC